MASLTFVSSKGKAKSSVVNWLRKWFNSHQVILSRGLCTHFDLKNEDVLSREQMAKRAYLYGVEKSPFDEVGIYVRVGKTRTTIWCWDKSFVEQATRSAGITCVPESALIDTSKNGFQLITAMDGYEAILVHENAVVHSRWWANPPSEHDWTKFLLSAEQFGWGHVPFPGARPPLKYSSLKPPTNDISSQDVVSQIHLDRVMLAAVLFTGLVLLYPFSRFLYLNAINYSLQSTIDQSTNYFEEKLTLSNQISSIRSETNDILEVISEPQILIAYSQALSQIVDFEGSIERVLFDAGNWEIMFTSEAGFEPTQFVRSLEDKPNIVNVSIEPERRDKYWITKFQSNLSLQAESVN